MTTETAAPVDTAPAATPAGQDTNAGTQQPTTEAPAAVEYVFVAPEGQTYDDKIVTTVTEFAKENKLTATAAQKLLDTQHDLLAAQSKALADTVAEWKTKLAADPKLGGEHLDANRAVANKTIALGTPELAKLLEDSGMIHHPEVFGFLHNVGKMLSEDRFVAAGNQPGSAGKTLAKSLYPNNS
jgi:hypothetical protein